MINMYISVDQDQRLKNDLAAIEAQNDRQTDLYCAGEFDGVIGIDPNPEMWYEIAYKSGFLDGIARHYDNKYQVGLTNEPF
jgi:hypothetical protein